MKKSILLLCLSLGLGYLVMAQCDRKTVWVASKAEFMGDSGVVEQTKDVTVTVETSGSRIKIIHSDDESDTLSGPVKEIHCGWKEPFKEGSVEYICDLSERNGDHANSMLRVDAKDAKITINLFIESPDGRKRNIRIPVESFRQGS